MTKILDDNAIISAQVEQNSQHLLSKLKEESLVIFYYGIPTCAPQDFVDGQFDHVLLGRLNSENLSLPQQELLVKEFLSNYQLWACTAKMHTQKSFNAVRLSHNYIIFILT